MMDDVSTIITRITHMEQLHDLVRDAVDSSNVAGIENLADAIHGLQAYYEGPEWLSDHDADQRGLLPRNLKRGILSEDTLYNLFGDIDSVLKSN